MVWGSAATCIVTLTDALLFAEGLELVQLDPKVVLVNDLCINLSQSRGHGKARDKQYLGALGARVYCILCLLHVNNLCVGTAKATE